MLRELCRFARGLDLPPSLYSERPVRYIIELDPGGRLLNPQPTDTADIAQARTRNGVRRLVPTVQRTSGIQPLLLSDNAEYSFGLARNASPQFRVDAAHAAYMELVDRCAAVTGDSAVRAVAKFLGDNPAGQLDLEDDFDRSANVTFRAGNKFPIDAASVQEFWAKEHDPGRSTDAVIGQCLVCGQERPLLERFQAKLKRVPGGQSSGTALISANAKVFESYGLDASLTAPTCGECGELFTAGLNHLLASETQSSRIGSVAFAHWTSKPDVDINPLALCSSPNPDQVAALFESVFGATRVANQFDDSPFYALALSGSGGRAIVRDWIDTTLGEVRKNLAHWFKLHLIVGRGGENPAPIGLFALAASTVRDAGKELSPITPRAMLRAALAATPLPSNLLSEAVRRNRAEQNVTRPRAALIKAVLLSRQRDFLKEDLLIHLDENSCNPAYRCGRLLAVLESTQYSALRISTVTDRFYGAASSAPASVFGRLLKGAQPHLAKLERDRPGAHNALQQRIENILAGLHRFPKSLDMESQGQFALGFYHQRAHDRAQARARRATTDANTGESQPEDKEA